jgi:hypothetical protein
MKLPDPAALWWQIVHANKPLLLLGAGCYTLAVAVSGLKWGVLLHAAGIDLPQVAAACLPVDGRVLQQLSARPGRR